jgi:tetratricopeptide (TPR) repeat protein
MKHWCGDLAFRLCRFTNPPVSWVAGRWSVISRRQRPGLFGKIILCNALTLIPLMLAAPGAIANEIDDQLEILPNNANAGASRDVADQWMQLGNDYASTAQYDRAIRAWQEAAAIYQVLGDQVAEGLAYSRLGATFGMLGRYPEAEQALIIRIGLASDNGNIPGQVIGLNNLGTLYLNQNRLEDATAKFEAALQLAESIGHDQGMGISLSNLGLVAVQNGEMEIAAERLEAATNYRFLAGDYLGEAHSSNNLGDVYVALGRDSNAIGAYRVALRAGKDANDRGLQLRALDGLMGIYLERQEWDTVEDYLGQRIALTLNTEPADLQTAITFRWMGDYYLALGDIEAAADAYQQSLVIARSLENKPLEAELTNRLLSLRR